MYDLSVIVRRMGWAEEVEEALSLSLLPIEHGS